MSINAKVYKRIGYADVRRGMDIRIVTEGPGIKSDVEGTVDLVNQAWARAWRDGSIIPSNGTVTFENDPATPHVIQYHYNPKVSTELYEVIEAIPEEPKGVGAVVRVVNFAHSHRTMEAVKTGYEGLWAWVGAHPALSWEELAECVLSGSYDYIEVLSEGVEL